MSTEYHTSEGVVLKKMPAGEADFLIRVLSQDFGKIDLLAKGARKSTAKLNSHLDMFNFVRLSWVKNGERLPTLIDAEIIERFDYWFLDAEHIASIGRIGKCLDALLPAGAEDSEALALLISFLRTQLSAQALGEYEHTFLNKFLEHEGYATAFLPPEVSDVIMRLWPNWKS